MQLPLSPAQLPAEMLPLPPLFFAAEWIAMFLDADKMQCVHESSVARLFRFRFLLLFAFIFLYYI
jgi:hypothetical protein